ncbi:MAG: hypothetical protein ACI8UO_005757 [Verrucomicrobiales bacterium]|jgi:hypothetical protein
MNFTKPLAESSTPEELEKLRRAVERLQLVGLANNTKWNELITHFRLSAGWIPKFRFKCVDGPIASWDGEWWYHLPFPFLSVLWFDIQTVHETALGRLLPPKIEDHTSDIEELLSKTGFDYQKGNGLIRIFGYSPKDYRGFE